MRRIQVCKALAVGLVAGVVCSASADVINFDDLVGQAAVPNGYGGVQNWSGWTYYDWDQPPYNPHSPPCRIYTNSGRFSYGREVIFNGAWFSGFGTNRGFLPIHFELYLNNALVHTSGSLDLGDGSGPTWLASGYNGSCDTIQVVGSHGYYVMDDVDWEEAGGFRLSVTGDCPGRITVSWRGGNPNGATQGLVVGQSQGSFTIPNNQPCGGTVLGIQGSVQLADPPGLFNNQGGQGSVSGNVGTAACGRYMQAVEGGSCQITNVVQIPQ